MPDMINLRLLHLLKKFGEGPLYNLEIGIDSPFIQEMSEEINKMESTLKRLNLILDTSPNTISWVTSDLTYLGVNNALAKTCGLNKDDFIDRPIGFYTKNKYFYNFCKLLFQSKSKTIYQELSAKINNEERKFWVSATKYENDTQALMVGIDITNLKNLENHISLTEKLSALGEMVAETLHEISNPITVIEGNSKRILRGIDKEKHTSSSDVFIPALEKIQKAAEGTLNASTKIKKIVKGVKTFVRHGNQDPLERENIYEIVTDAICIVEGKLKSRDISITVDDSLKKLNINCNMTHIFQVIVNLLTNAADGMENLDKKWIKISGSALKDKVILQIVDAGAGIPKDIAKNIFDSFFTTKKLGMGTGIGLSLCRRIMGEHHGTIEIVHNMPNTTFQLIFPQSQEL